MQSQLKYKEFVELLEVIYIRDFGYTKEKFEEDLLSLHFDVIVKNVVVQWGIGGIQATEKEEVNERLKSFHDTGLFNFQKLEW